MAESGEYLSRVVSVRDGFSARVTARVGLPRMASWFARAGTIAGEALR